MRRRKTKQGRRGKKKCFSLWSAVNGRPPHKVAVRVDVVVGAQGSGVRCNGAVVGFGRRNSA